VSCRLNFIYVSDQDIIDYEETGETSLDGHTTADLSISKSIFTMDKSGELSVKIDVRNLFDKQYALVQGYPMPGRSIYAGLKYVY
jgi:vitamin B12 transporter